MGKLQIKTGVVFTSGGGQDVSVAAVVFGCIERFVGLLYQMVEIDLIPLIAYKGAYNIPGVHVLL